MVVQIFENGDPNDEIRMTFLLCSGDGECGATDPEAFNYEPYDPATVYDDGSCIPTVLGCTSAEACNYNEAANTNDGNCFFPDALGDCDGDCLADEDQDGLCDDNDPCVGQYDDCGCATVQALDIFVDQTLSTSPFAFLHLVERTRLPLD